MRLSKRSRYAAAFRAVNASRKNDPISVRFDYDFTNMLGLIIENYDEYGNYLAVKFHPIIIEEDFAVRASLDGDRFRKIMQGLDTRANDKIEMKFDHARSAVNILVNEKSQGYVDFEDARSENMKWKTEEMHRYRGEQFINLLNYLTEYTTKDKNRQVLKYININENGSRLFSTNGRIVGRINDLNPGHNDVFNEVNIYETIAKDAKNILVTERGCHVMRFHAENMDGYYGLTDGSICMINKLPLQYPDAEKAYFGDGDPKYIIAVNREQLANAVNALNKINEHENKRITLSINKDLETLTLHQKGAILNNVSADIDIKFVDTMDIPPDSNIIFDQMSLSVEYLHAILNGITDNTIKLRFVLWHGNDDDTKDSLMLPTKRNPLYIEIPNIGGDMLIMPLRS